MKNSIEEDIKILEGIIKGDEDCINAIYSQMKVKNDNDEDIQYYKKEIQSIKNIVDNYLKEKARADKLEKEYSAMLTESDENECDYKRVLKENEELKEKESRIYKEVQESLSFEKFLIAKDIGPDLFNLGRFYISQIIYDILNNAENPEGIHKENKYIKYIDYIPVQKVKDKIRHYQELQDNYIKKYDEINEGLQAMINVLQELLEGRK